MTRKGIKDNLVNEKCELNESKMEEKEKGNIETEQKKEREMQGEESENHKEFGNLKKREKGSEKSEKDVSSNNVGIEVEREKEETDGERQGKTKKENERQFTRFLDMIKKSPKKSVIHSSHGANGNVCKVREGFANRE